MKVTPIVAAVVSLGVLAGCQPEVKPSPPPTSEPALTTTTPAPTPQPTEEEEPTTDAPTTEAAATTEAPEPTSAEPEVAMDQTEEGAVAFVEHYIETLNAVHISEADVDDLRELAQPSCRSCSAFTDAADEVLLDRRYIDHISSRALLVERGARIDSTIEQADSGDRIDAVFRLTWEQDQWLVSEIQLAG
ncbi:MAG: hypothetical protein Q4F67_13790 [Propionibacteriaceae bacterium]|nr:hypothetical protein [Propionibacteriaceae bacterium]MDO5500743.1 hypothetical protein [Propionibacteriaceae bacterium]